jgi:hypothetical protein
MISKLSVTVYLFLALYGSTTIQTRSFLINIAPDDCTFFSGRNYHSYQRPDDCTYFFQVVIMNPPKHPSSWKPPKHSHWRPAKNIAGPMTVPIFPVVIFWGRNWCSYFDTNTNYGTWKNYDLKKKIQVLWPAMFFEPPEKIMILQNFGGNWDYIIFRRIVLGSIFFFKTTCRKIIWSQFPPNFGRNWDYIFLRQIVLGSIFFRLKIFYFGAPFRYKWMYYNLFHVSDLCKIVRCLREIECIQFECKKIVLVLVQIDLIHIEHSNWISSTWSKTN